MKYYIVDDDLAIVQSLEYIISECNLGEVAGSSTDSFTALEDILDYKPDIVLVDFLMSGMDGVKLVRRVREKRPDQAFVMLSKVTDKVMIQKAYDAGIEFFISKPISIVEVQKVLTNVSQRIKMQGIMNNLQSMFGGAVASETIAPVASKQASKEAVRRLNILFSELGILGERGLQDVRAIFTYMKDNNCDYDKSILDVVALDMNDTVKNVEQRVRRALRKGLTNAATAGLVDMDSDSYAIYANYVFNMTSLKDEMDYIRGVSHTGGRISISRFMDGLMVYSEHLE